MEWWQAVILGFVQGITEFLPVSSSGHLILARDLIGVADGDYLLFDVLLHAATLLAVVLVLHKDIIKLFKPPFKTLGWIVLASIPAVVTGFLLKPTLETFFDGPKYLCFFFLLTAVLMFSAELIGKRISLKQFFTRTFAGVKRIFTRKKDGVEENEPPLLPAPVTEESPDGKTDDAALEQIKLKNAVGMGLMQAAALFPGLSRSGSTLFGGIVTGGKRESLAKFSFLMSIPIILGAAVLELKDVVFPAENSAPAVFAWHYLLAMAVAFIVGFAAVKFMLRIIAKADYKWFAFYLFALSIFTFFYYFL